MRLFFMDKKTVNYGFHSGEVAFQDDRWPREMFGGPLNNKTMRWALQKFPGL